MKKIIVLITILLTGCSGETTKECSYEINDINRKINTTYEIKYKDNKVLKYREKTIYTFKNSDDVKLMNIELENYEDLKHYKKTTKEKDNTLIVETSIDFDKIDLAKLKEIEKEHVDGMYQIVEDLKVTPLELASNIPNEICKIK